MQYSVCRCGLVLQTVDLSVCHSSDCPAKTAEPVEMPFGLWAESPRNRVLGGVHTGATRRIPLNRPSVAAMWPVIKLL